MPFLAVRGRETKRITDMAEAGTTENQARSPLRLAINASHAKTGGGVTYLRRMLPLFAATEDVTVVLILHRDQAGLFDPLPPGIELVSCDYQAGFLSTLAWEQFSLPRLARGLKADVLFSPANFGPVFKRNHVVLLRNAVSVIRLARRPKQLAYWLMLSAATFASLMTARQAIAVSDYAAGVLTFGLRGMLGKKISIVHHGTATIADPRPSNDVDGTRLLAVSDIYVQKNYDTLLRALAILRPDRPDLSLTIAGREVDAVYAASLRELVDDLGLSDAVTFAGHVDHDNLQRLYRDCVVFVFPSTVETFGNPLLEAMAVGAPIATSNAPAMREVAAECALYFDPADPDGMAASISQLLDNPDMRIELGRKAAERAQQFTWENTAVRTLEVLRMAAR